MAAVTGCLLRGQPVMLGTREPGGHVVRPVRDRIDLGRRLARAVPPPPGRRRPERRRVGPEADGVTLWQRVVQANRPGPPEHSVPFRVASAGTVIIAIGGLLEPGRAQRRRWPSSPSSPPRSATPSPTGAGSDPWPAVKPILAVCAIGGFVWFIATVSHNATPGDISTVEAPLAVLFAWVLCTHAFDVPARRDVAYSLAGSAALMAVAAAQSVDLTLGVYVVAWVACGLWGLVAMWQSMSGTSGVPWLTLGVAGVAGGWWWPSCWSRCCPPRRSRPR